MKPKKIVVLGAGTSGWITASAIKKNNPDVDVLIVYDSRMPTIGVGETLTFSMPYFMKQVLGLQDEEWMDKVKATYKTGITMKSWTDPKEDYQSGHIVDFPSQFLFKGAFENIAYLTNSAETSREDYYKEYGSVADLWYTLYQQGKLPGSTPQDLTLTLSEGAQFANKGRSIRNTAGDWFINEQVGYSYHYNAEMVGTTIGELVGKPAGVRSVDSFVNRVEVEQGNIKNLHLDNGDVVTADLFIDCSGFKRLLVSQLDYKWVDSDEAYNNAAMVTQVPYSDKDNRHHRLSSNTILAGANHGWRFSIPLQNRSGNGYIFNSRMGWDQDAIADEFSTELGIKKSDFRVIKWNPGRYENPAVGNCIALGLAQGFTDPFDANNLSLTIKLVTELVNMLKSNSYDIAGIRTQLNERSHHWWNDIDIRVESCLRLSPRRDTEHYRAIADFAERTKLKERFIEHVIAGRKRNNEHPKYFLWKTWTHLILAARYGIEIPNTNYTTDMETLAKKYFEFNKFKYDIMSANAPELSEYYLTAMQ